MHKLCAGPGDAMGKRCEPAVNPKYVICPDASKRPDADNAKHDTLPVWPCVGQQQQEK